MIPHDDASVQEWVRGILEDPANRENPLLEVVRLLADKYARQTRKLEKVTRISDRFQVQMRELNQTLHTASITDPLTGLVNRREMLARLQAEACRADRSGLTFAVIAADVDYFKRINDTHGHDAGDVVLAEIARTLGGCIRQYDTCCRWGGEEFMLLFPSMDMDTVCATAERLRREVAEQRFVVDDTLVPVTVSLGVAVHRSGEPVGQCIQRADQALYAAKRQGRNRWVMEEAG